MSSSRLKRNQSEANHTTTEHPNKLIKSTTNNTKHKQPISNKSKPKPPSFKGREVVFVDPLDENEEYWWPAMVVPFCELDSSMVSTVLQPGECVVKYFEDNKYSVVMYKDLKLFKTNREPFVMFEKKNRNFSQRAGVRSALNFIKSQRPTKRFKWRLWGDMERLERASGADRVDDTATNSSRDAKKPLATKAKGSKPEPKKAIAQIEVKRDDLNDDGKSDKATSTESSSSLPTPPPPASLTVSGCPTINTWIDKYLGLDLITQDREKFDYRCQLLLHKLQKRYRKSQNDLTYVQRDLIQALPNHVVRKLRTQDRRQKK